MALIGRAVVKNFGHGSFGEDGSCLCRRSRARPNARLPSLRASVGTVVSVDELAQPPIYQVRYEDGDEEDLEEAEVIASLQSHGTSPPVENLSLRQSSPSPVRADSRQQDGYELGASQQV
eukprot:SAG31_NODE_5500_length_2499_cov_1.921667_2_plen_120_part_00